MPPAPSATLRLMPAVFVLLWSTGFVGAKLGLPYAPPLTFLAIRFVVVALLLLAWIALAGSPWPRRAQLKHVAVAALLLHTIYLGGVFVAISWGLEAGTSALIVSVQPLLVAALAGPLLGERVTPRQWIGLALGLAGVALVVWRKAGLDEAALAGAALCLVSLIAITAGVLYQKRFLGDMPLVTGNAIQFVVAALSTLLLALLLEEWRVVWDWRFVFALGWLVVVLSLGAMALFVLLIRRGAASRVSSLFFLVPPTAALMAWPLFGETLHGLEWAGMALVVLGVALVNLRRR
jgi:drug/metabolite transporter (DMT)-like permease